MSYTSKGTHQGEDRVLFVLSKLKEQGWEILGENLASEKSRFSKIGYKIKKNEIVQDISIPSINSCDNSFYKYNWGTVSTYTIIPDYFILARPDKSGEFTNNSKIWIRDSLNKPGGYISYFEDSDMQEQFGNDMFNWDILETPSIKFREKELELSN